MLERIRGRVRSMWSLPIVVMAIAVVLISQCEGAARLANRVAFRRPARAVTTAIAHQKPSPPSGKRAAKPARTPAVETFSALGLPTSGKLTARELEAIDAANRRTRGTVPVFREASITQVPVDGTTTVAAENGFVISFPTALTGVLRITPAVYGGVLVLGGPSSSMRVYGFDAHTGKPLWADMMQDDGPSAPACEGGVCAFTTESCSLYVIDAKTGAPLWGRYLGDPLMGAPAISKGRVFAAFPNFVPGGPAKARSSIAAFDVKSGHALWRKRMDDDVISAPVARGDDLSVTTLSGAVFQFSQADGRPISAARRPATRERANGHAGRWWNADGAAYLMLREMPKPRDSRALRFPDRTCLTRDGDVVCSDPEGIELWDAKLDATTPPIAAGGSVWVGTGGGDVVRLDLQTGAIVRKWEVGGAVQAEPLLVDGWIYAPTDQGLVAIDTRDASVTGWSQWGGNAERALSPAELAALAAPTPVEEGVRSEEELFRILRTPDDPLPTLVESSTKSASSARSSGGGELSGHLSGARAP